MTKIFQDLQIINVLRGEESAPGLKRVLLEQRGFVGGFW